jgi:dolichyl-phosphate beta-glucosyltransferase
MIDLTVVVPAYNEEKRIAETLRRIVAYLDRRGTGFEIVLVDDGSADRTVECARSAVPDEGRLRVLRQPANRGKGRAVREGMLAGRGRMLLFSDADLSTPIEDLPRLEAAIDRGADVAFGSRAVRGSEVVVRQPLYRQTMGKAFNLMVQALLLPGVRDSQCGFKLFRREAGRRIFAAQRLEGFSFDVEVLFLARKMGLRIAEVPVRWYNSPESRVHPIRHSLQMLRDLIRTRLASWSGTYRE